MKKKYILILCALLSQVKPVQGMVEGNEELHGIRHQAVQPGDVVASLREKITYMRKEFGKHAVLYANPNKVIIIGPSGSGKSTLVHRFAGIPLIAQENEAGEVYLKPQHSLPGFNISHDTRVGTPLPCPWYDQKNDRVFWDCPGFGDPRGIVDEIANASAIHKLFNTQSNFTVILTISENELKEKASKFKNLLNQIAKIFPESGQLEKNLYFILTKQTQIRNPIEKLRMILNQSTSIDAGALEKRAREILSFLINEGNRVMSFPYPRQLGDYNLESSILSPFTPDLEKLEAAGDVKSLNDKRKVEFQTKETQELFDLQQKADRKDPEACFELGRYLYEEELNKIDRSQDIEKYQQAQRYLQIAAEKEHQEAKIYLDKINSAVNSN